MRSRRLARRLALLAAMTALAAPLHDASGAGSEAGSVRGSVRVAVAGGRVADAGPMVVYLEPSDGAPPPPPPSGVARVNQRDARFAPQFLVIAAGQTVAMPNDDAIYHNVFSYSTPNDFDLGLYPAGESRKVTFRHPGVVRIYCSIHESMNGTIYVAPTAYFAVVRPNGEFEIRDVAPGRYRLTTWCERLPAAVRQIEVAAGRVAAVDLEIGTDGR